MEVGKMFASLVLALVAAQPVKPFFPAPRPYPPGLRQETETAAGPRATNPPHVLYLNFDGATLRGGNCNNSATNCSFIVNGATYNFPAYTNDFRKPMIVAAHQ